MKEPWQPGTALGLREVCLRKCFVSSEHFCHRRLTHRDDKLTVTAFYEFEQKDNVICRELFLKITSPNAAL